LSPSPGRRRRVAALLALTATAALAAGLWVHFSGGDADTVRTVPRREGVSGRRGEGVAAHTAEAARVDRALVRSVSTAAALGGSVEAGVVGAGRSDPAIETSTAAGESRWMRMWSMSKVATLIALLRLLGWGEQPGRPVPPEVEEALQGAIRRSENCRQRRVVLELERLAAGAAGARGALAGVFRDAGARVRIGSEREAPESSCVPYLETQHGVADPLAPALLLGTSTWRIGDAVRLAGALSAGTFGKAVSRRVLALLGAPKLPSREVAAGDLTAPLDWGAGRAFAGLAPAYKAGWGGSMNGNFLAGQIAVVTLPGEGRLAVAVMFHPDEQPSRDDPGITAAPEAVELVMHTVRNAVSD
jgi:hypothetical protein